MLKSTDIVGVLVARQMIASFPWPVPHPAFHRKRRKAGCRTANEARRTTHQVESVPCYLLEHARIAGSQKLFEKGNDH